MQYQQSAGKMRRHSDSRLVFGFAVPAAVLGNGQFHHGRRLPNGQKNRHRKRPGVSGHRAGRKIQEARREMDVAAYYDAQQAAAVRAAQERAAQRTAAEELRREEMRRAAQDRAAAARAQTMRRAREREVEAERVRREQEKARAGDVASVADARAALETALGVAAAAAEHLRRLVQERAEEEAAAALARERDMRVQKGLLGMPDDVLHSIIELVKINDESYGTRLGCCSKFFYSALGGLEGARQRRQQFIEARDRQRKAAERQLRRKRAKSKKIRKAAAVIELVLREGQHGVGYKSMARKNGISQPCLRCLHSNLAEEGFFGTPGWENNVMDSPWLSDTDMSDSDGE